MDPVQLLSQLDVVTPTNSPADEVCSLCCHATENVANCFRLCSFTLISNKNSFQEMLKHLNSVNGPYHTHI